MRLRAVQILIFATLLWGVSFPTTKALALAQDQLLGGSQTWFFASLLTLFRFGIAALVLLVISAKTLRGVTRQEISQGVGLGLFGGMGILLQVDGLAHTAASTSAFLTQATCLFIPVWVACQERRRPAGRVLLSCGLVIIGGGVLAGLDWRHLELGRGELETIAAAAFFAGQILWLGRPQYASNNVNHFSLIMFAVMALVCLPVAVVATVEPAHWWRAWASPAAVTFLAILVIPCTFGAYMLMNHWQRYVTPTQAGLIYCCEPVFASIFAVCLPAVFSRWAAIDYPNERITFNLLLGGTFITIANILTLAPSGSAPTVAASTEGVQPENPG